MSRIPRDGAVDSTLALLREGYPFVSRRCAGLRTDAFETRLMLRPAVCARGTEAAEVFYVPGRFTRRGALPPQVLRLLQGKGSVATLDGAAHRHRKAMFMHLMSEESIVRLVALAQAELREAAAGWAARERVVLHDGLREVLCRAVCGWAGVPLADGEARQRTRELGAMISGAGSIGPRSWHALLLRRRAERWARGAVRACRGGALAAAGSPLATIALHQDERGLPLTEADAAVEVLNLLRPTVAVARFAVFAALALHEHPGCREAVAADPAYRRRFVQEVRRFYPFFPAVAGRVREPFEWRGRWFGPGDRFILDLYGTNRDPAAWDRPDEFDPDRFAAWSGSAYDFIPQGGGDHHDNHRCPGEWITIALLEMFAAELAGGLGYRVPAQDLAVDLAQIPALPASGFVIDRVAPGQARISSPSGEAA